MHTNPTLEIRVRVQKTLKPERRSASIRFELSACLHKPAQRSPLCRQVVLQSARSPLCLRAFARANGVLRERSSSPTEFFAIRVLRKRRSSKSHGHFWTNHNLADVRGDSSPAWAASTPARGVPTVDPRGVRLCRRLRRGAAQPCMVPLGPFWSARRRMRQTDDLCACCCCC